MTMLASYFTILFLNLVLTAAIEYSVTTKSEKVIHYDKEVIETEEEAKKLTIEDDFPVLDDDMVQIYEKTAIFMMTRNEKLRTIKRGAFVDQEITKTIVITNTQVEVIPRGAFRNLKIFELVLKDNKIRHIEEEAFADMPNLEIVSLARNKLVQFHGNSFVDAPIKYIDLAFNELTVIEEFWFSFMSDEAPTTVLLDNNEIDFIDSKAFERALLGTLNVRSNKLESLPSELFKGDSLTRIFLQDNQLQSLPHSFYELTQLTLVDVTDNPLECDDKKKLKKLAKDTDAEIKFEEDC